MDVLILNNILDHFSDPSDDRTVVVDVLGPVYVGLPFAVESTRSGYRLIGSSTHGVWWCVARTAVHGSSGSFRSRANCADGRCRTKCSTNKNQF